MLDDKRIKEAGNNVRQYLEEGLLKKEKFNGIIFKILQNNAKESLEVANFLAKNEKSDLWIVITSYYSMYYIANAVLYRLGYKVGEKISHKITADALIIFVRKKLAESILKDYEEAKDEALAMLKSDELLQSFDFERKKRSFIQYQTKEFEKHSKAETSFTRAKKFILEMEKLL